MRPNIGRWRQASVLLAIALLSACGGSVDVTLWWSSDDCAVAPPIVSVAPATATVGQLYVYPLVFGSSSACGPASCFDVLPLRMPAGAMYEPASQRVTWTPTAGQAGTTMVFEMATVTRDCGRHTSWTWTVRVLP